MTKLTQIRKQIAALEAEAARITKVEMTAAIDQAKALIEKFGLTVEHLGINATRALANVVKAGKKSKSPKRSGAGVTRYADPKTGKTWSGFGRAPGWIAGAKNRDAFRVDASTGNSAEPVAATTPKKKSAVSTKSTRKVAAPSKSASRTATAKPSKASAKKATPKKAASKKIAATKAPAVAKKAAAKAPAKKAKAMAKAVKPASAQPAVEVGAAS